MGECATLLSYQSPQLSSFLALDVLEAVKDLLVVLRGTPRGEPGAGELLNELFNRAEVGPAGAGAGAAAGPLSPNPEKPL
mmetsp:Transcript_7850/g.20106  ORF Transcript_7850/g.20106 Transcript_7850/m.20106 type:complete len:80 (+) Transcript_7850:126-365(+)